MKTGVFAFPSIIALAGSLWAGCSTQHAQRPAADKPVYVAPWGAQPTYDQPTPKENVFGAPPNSRLNWVEGYWAFVDWHWFWVPGHWEEHWPRNAAWVPGRWDRTNGQWIWVPGHWQ